MTVDACLAEATQTLLTAGVNSARLDGLILLEETTQQDRAWLLAHSESKLTFEQFQAFRGALSRRAAREPLAYITGKVWFYGRQFTVTPAVLIPRPETESVVEAALALADTRARILEIGTGAGAIAVSLQAERADLAVMATDVSEDALQLAEQNARRLGVAQLRFAHADLLVGVNGVYDIVVANLPYVAQQKSISPEVAWEPSGALYGGEDGLDVYRRLFEQLGSREPAAPHVVLEAEPEQQSVLVGIAKAAHYHLVEHHGFCYQFALQK